MSTFIARSRCDVMFNSNVPTVDVLLNLVGMSMNSILISSGRAPVVGRHFLNVPEYMIRLQSMCVDYAAFQSPTDLAFMSSKRLLFRGDARTVAGIPLVGEDNQHIVFETLDSVSGVRVCVGAARNAQLIDLTGIVGTFMISPLSYYVTIGDNEQIKSHLCNDIDDMLEYQGVENGGDHNIRINRWYLFNGGSINLVDEITGAFHVYITPLRIAHNRLFDFYSFYDPISSSSRRYINPRNRNELPDMIDLFLDAFQVEVIEHVFLQLPPDKIL